MQCSPLSDDGHASRRGLPRCPSPDVGLGAEQLPGAGPKHWLHEHTWLRPRGEQKTGGQRARGHTPKQKHPPLTFQRPGTWRGGMLAGGSPERAALVEDTVARKDFNHTSHTEIALTGPSQGPRARERVPHTEEH